VGLVSGQFSTGSLFNTVPGTGGQQQQAPQRRSRRNLSVAPSGVGQQAPGASRAALRTAVGHDGTDPLSQGIGQVGDYLSAANQRAGQSGRGFWDGAPRPWDPMHNFKQLQDSVGDVVDMHDAGWAAAFNEPKPQSQWFDNFSRTARAGINENRRLNSYDDILRAGSAHQRMMLDREMQNRAGYRSIDSMFGGADHKLNMQGNDLTYRGQLAQLDDAQRRRNAARGDIGQDRGFLDRALGLNLQGEDLNMRGLDIDERGLDNNLRRVDSSGRVLDLDEEDRLRQHKIDTANHRGRWSSGGSWFMPGNKINRGHIDDALRTDRGRFTEARYNLDRDRDDIGLDRERIGLGRERIGLSRQGHHLNYDRGVAGLDRQLRDFGLDDIADNIQRALSGEGKTYADNRSALDRLRGIISGHMGTFDDQWELMQGYVGIGMDEARRRAAMRYGG
jgi:hypothetical protein